MIKQMAKINKDIQQFNKQIKQHNTEVNPHRSVHKACHLLLADFLLLLLNFPSPEVDTPWHIISHIYYAESASLKEKLKVQKIQEQIMHKILQ